MPDINLPSTAAGPGLAADPTHLLAILWRGRRMIAACMAGCLALAVVYLLTTPRLYQATAKLLVLQQGGRPLSVAGGDQGRLADSGEDTIPTHAMVLKSPAVVGRAIEKVGLRNLPSLAAGDDLQKAIREATKNLSVTRPDRQAKILQVDYRARARDEAVRLVGAITDSYRAFLEEVYQKNNSEVVYLMTKARDDLNGELVELEKKYKAFRQENPQIIGDGTGRPLIVRRIEEWNRATTESLSRAMQLKEQLELGQKLARDGAGLWAIAYAMDQVGSQASGVGLRTQPFTPTATSSDYIRQLNQEQQRLADRHGPQSTKVREIQEQINGVLEHARASRNRIEQVEVSDLLASIEESLKSIERLRKKIDERLEQDMAVAKTTEAALIEESNLKSNLERQRMLFHGVVDQLKQAKLVGDFASLRAETIEPANALTSAVWPKKSLILAIAIAVGLVLGTGGAVAGDLLDPRVRSIEEMRKVLELPLLGQIPQLPDSPGPRPAPIGLICHALPRSPSAEAYKVARASLDLARRHRGTRVVLVTSPRSGEGKTTVASNLAICVAQAGRRVLLVDADLRRPTLHKLHGVQRERGLVHVLRELMPLSRVVQPTSIKNLEIVASGPEASNPAEILSSPSLHDFLAKVRNDYDTVIIDSPPLLEVADPSIVGAVADGIVLVVRASATRRDEASRALEVLRGLGTPPLGAVVNGVGAEENTFAYGQPDADAFRLAGRPSGEIRPEPKLSFASNGAAAKADAGRGQTPNDPTEGHPR